MELSKEDKNFIRDLLQDVQPMFNEYMEHLRVKNPEEYERYRTKAVVSLGMCS